MSWPHSAVSRRSMSSVGTCNTVNHEGNYRATVHVLYNELQTQLCASYRPHVEYIPPSRSPTPDAEEGRYKVKLKTAKNVISAVHRLQHKEKERVHSGDKRSNTSLETQDSTQSMDSVVLSKSLPNLTAGKTSPNTV